MVGDDVAVVVLEHHGEPREAGHRGAEVRRRSTAARSGTRSPSRTGRSWPRRPPASPTPARVGATHTRTLHRPITGRHARARHQPPARPRADRGAGPGQPRSRASRGAGRTRSPSWTAARSSRWPTSPMLGEAIPMAWWDIVGAEDCRRLLACLHVVVLEARPAGRSGARLRRRGDLRPRPALRGGGRPARLGRDQDAGRAARDRRLVHRSRATSPRARCPAPSATSATRSAPCRIRWPTRSAPFGLDHLTLFDLFAPRDSGAGGPPGLRLGAAPAAAQPGAAARPPPARRLASSLQVLAQHLPTGPRALRLPRAVAGPRPRTRRIFSQRPPLPVQLQRVPRSG